MSAASLPDPEGVSPALAGAPILVHVVRSGIVENIHHVTAVVTWADGTVAQAWGDPAGPILPRSASKPLQALAMLEAGLDLPPHLLALACASHSAEPFHLAGVHDILTSAGLDDDALQNTPAYPIDDDEHDAWVRLGRNPSALGQNCSGKHAAMLATCVAAGWDTQTYLQRDHPLQRTITRTIERVSGERVQAFAVDGCGAPAHYLPIVGLARAFGRLASAPAGTATGRVADAMRGHPTHVGGTRRDVTALMAALPGLVAKEGAAGVYAVGLADGRGVAVKAADGSMTAPSVVLAALLRSLGAGSQQVWSRLADAPVLGHGRPVGATVAVGI
ncbi:MAG: asparaginase [Dermatophilaceae bacterium]